MRRGLVGYTGFVGGTLVRAAPFQALYNSSNAREMRGRQFDQFVVAGAPAEKWRANQDPDRDRASIDDLIANISEVEAASAILVSTVDVYPNPVAVDEYTAIDKGAQHAYGRHRLLLEEAFRARFRSGPIVRLPALFGAGLKKNAIFDLLHQHETWKLHAQAQFQFYSLSWLWADLQRFQQSGVDLVNAATEPVTLAEACREAFGYEFDNDPGTPPARYDMRTRYDVAFGGRGGYLYDRAAVLAELAAFVARARGDSA
jgi:predicted transcriptional regulator